MDNPQKEQLQDPKWSILEDGNGYQVLAQGGLPFVDSSGRRCVKFKIIPDGLVRNRYNLRRGAELDENTGAMFITFLEIDLIPLNIYDDSNRKWLYTKTFKHEITPLSEREIFYKQKNESYEQQVLLLQAKVIKLNEELKLATLQTAKYLTQGVEVFERSTGVVASMMNKKDKEDKNG